MIKVWPCAELPLKLSIGRISGGSMPKQSFDHVDIWVFDLDNTLYPPEARLFDQIEEKMTTWVSHHLGVSRSEANGLRADYWARFGTTLSGLMRLHGIAPEAYLRDVHDIDFSPLTPDPTLAEAIRRLPGRKIVYTNADTDYAGKVLAARGLSDLFDAVYGIENADYQPKPERDAFEKIFEQAQLDPTRAAMFEDDPRNLMVPFEMGMQTVLVAPEPTQREFIGFHTASLEAFLRAVA